MRKQNYTATKEELDEIIRIAKTMKGPCLERSRQLAKRFPVSISKIQKIIMPHIKDRTFNRKLEQSEISTIIDLFNKSEMDMFFLKVKDVARQTGRSISLVRNLVIGKEKPIKEKMFDYKQPMF